MRRRPLLALGLALPAAALAQTAAVRVVVPYPPGGGIDLAGRIFAATMAPLLGESWVIENRSGANGAIGAGLVARAAPDGRTLLCNSDSQLMARAVMRDVPYDPVADFTPVARIARSPLVLVGAPSLRARTLAELLVEIRAAPERFAFANTSLGTRGHLATEVFRQEAGADLLVVSYRGTAPALADVAAGQTALMLAPLASAGSLVQAGTLRGYAVTSATRGATLPEVPTMAEAGMPALAGFAPWFALWGPRGLPDTVVVRVNAAARRAAADPAVIRRLAELGSEPVSETPAAFAAAITQESAAGLRILERAGVRPE